MKRQDFNEEFLLARAIGGVQEDTVDAAVEEAAGARVWAKLRAELDGTTDGAPIRGCGDVQRLLPAWREGRLPEARALLVKDHLADCVACRHAARHPAPIAMTPLRRAPAQPARRWGAIAAGVLLAALGSYAGLQRWHAQPQSAQAVVQSAEGSLLIVRGEQARPLRVSEAIAAGDLVRTASGSRAVLRLVDGSEVEMNERAQLAVAQEGPDAVIRLAQGGIIVQAAHRRSGHLYVSTRDCRVAVTGTVFSVDSATKGSRVSVIEGEVHVDQGGADHVLHAGDQIASTPAISSSGVADAVEWSQNREQHLKLLTEFSALRKKWEQIPLPGLRYQSRLLPMLPAGTVFVASVPNYGDAIRQGYDLFQEQLQQSPELRAWWERAGAGGHADELVRQVHAISEYLGDEILITAADDGPGRAPRLLIVAPLRRQGLRDYLAAESAKLGIPLEHVSIWQDADTVAVSPDPGAVQDFVRGKASGGFAQSPFGQRLAAAYRDGAGILVGADLATMAHRIPAQAKAADGLLAETTANLRYLIAEQKTVQGRTQNRAELMFGGTRRGLASWLAAPGPMGALQFVTPGAEAVLSVLSKDPVAMLDDVKGSGGPLQSWADLEQHLTINLRDDLAAALGREFTIALDGPLVPVPSWKIVAEVNDPARLQRAFEAIAAHVSDVQLASEPADGTTYYVLRRSVNGAPIEVHYTFSGAYFVAAPSRALVRQAVRAYETGQNLGRSDRFLALAPQDREANFSALLYQDLGSSLGSMVSEAAKSRGAAGNPLAQMAAEEKPTLTVAYGRADSIEIAGSGRLFGLESFSLRALLSQSVRSRGTSSRSLP